MTSCHFSVGIEGLVDALEAARGAPGRLDNAGRAEFVPSVGRPLVVREEVVGAECRSAVSHGASGTDQGNASGSVGAEDAHLPVSGAAARADAALLLFGCKLRAPGVVIVDPAAVVGRRPVVGSEIGKGGAAACRSLTLGLAKGWPRASTAEGC